MATLTELIETIQKETTLNKQWEDPNYLKDLLLRLASYYSTLGRFVAEAERDELTAKTHYEVTREQIKVEMITEGKPVKLSESTAAAQVEPEIQEYIQLKYKARLLFLTRQNLDKTMDAIRSSLAQQGREREGSKHAV